MHLRELENTVVHLKTEAERDEYLRLCEEGGWVWFGNGERPTEYRPAWEVYEDQLCIRAGDPLEYTGREWYKNMGYRILTLAEFKKEQGIDKDPKHRFKVGDWVEITESFSAPGVDYIYPRGARCQVFSVTNMGTILRLAQPDGLVAWQISSVPRENYRKCSPPEEKFARQVDESKPSDDEGFYTTDTCTHSIPSPVSSNKYSFTVSCASGSSISSSPSKRMSIRSLYRNSRLSSEERVLRKADIKDEDGLTEEGTELLLELLADKHKAELVAEAKKIIKARKDEDEDDDA